MRSKFTVKAAFAPARKQGMNFLCFCAYSFNSYTHESKTVASKQQHKGFIL